MTEFEEVSERYEEKDLARLIGKPIIGPKLNLLALESRVSNTYPWIREINYLATNYSNIYWIYF